MGYGKVKSGTVEGLPGGGSRGRISLLVRGYFAIPALLISVEYRYSEATKPPSPVSAFRRKRVYLLNIAFIIGNMVYLDVL